MNKCRLWLGGLLILCSGCGSMKPSSPNALIYLEAFDDRKQLYQLHKEHETTLILINRQLYKAPAECIPFTPRKIAEEHSRRKEAVATTTRNSGTGKAARKVAQQKDERKVAEKKTNRRSGQAVNSRKIKEDSSTRLVSQANNSRKQAVANQERKSRQIASTRKSASANSERNTVSANTQRKIAMNNDNRNLAKAKENYSCQCVKTKKRKGYELYGITRNKNVQVYDGIYLKKLENNFVKIKN